MSIERMLDRTLPLAERVRAAVYLALRMYPDLADEYDIALTALLADIAAADRLARACLPHEKDDDPADDQKAYDDACEDWTEALDAYRARMAQGVNRGDA